MATSSQKPVRNSVVLPEEAYARVQRMAAPNDVSIAWVIRQPVKRFLDSHEYRTELPFEISDERKAQSGRLIVLDAKYRIEEGLAEALNSIHTYRDALVREAETDVVEGVVKAA